MDAVAWLRARYSGAPVCDIAIPKNAKTGMANASCSHWNGRTADPRIQHWREGLHSRVNFKPPETATDYRDYISARTVPVISHEIGQ